jgi:hypothetical protein
MCDHISALCKSYFSHTRDLDGFGAMSITTQLLLLLDVLSILNLTTATLSFSLFLALSLVVCKLCLNARDVTRTPKLYAISPVLRSFNWLKINELIQFKILSQTYKFYKLIELSTFVIFSLISLLQVFVHLPL